MMGASEDLKHFSTAHSSLLEKSLEKSVSEAEDHPQVYTSKE
jgi:hypothetical protein